MHSDQELARYGLCNNVAGDLRVSGVRTLAPLSRLESVTGSLSIAQSPGLESLNGLEQLSAVGRLALLDDASLSDVRALSHLGAVREIAVYATPRLRSLRGLNRVRQLDKLTLRETGLYSVRGFEALQSVRALRVIGNRDLIDVGAFNAVSHAERVTIANNPRLSAHFGFFDGLPPETAFALSGNAGLEPAIGARFAPATLRAGIASR